MARTPQAVDFGREYGGQWYLLNSLTKAQSWRGSDWDLAKVRAVKFNFNLKPHSSVYAPLQFGWNETTGEVSGPGAELVRNNATAALKFGHIDSPYSRKYRLHHKSFNQSCAVGSDAFV